jgi:lactoylglutathione lyase
MPDSVTRSPLASARLQYQIAGLIRKFESKRDKIAEKMLTRRKVKRSLTLRYLHTMLRVADLNAALDFFVSKMDLVEVRRVENEKGRFTLVFLAALEDVARAAATFTPMVELTYNWDKEEYAGGRNFGHLAYEVDNIYITCEKLAKAGVVINRPPRDGRMAFIRSPDGISIELLQKGESLAPQEPWLSAPNVGTW